MHGAKPGSAGVSPASPGARASRPHALFHSLRLASPNVCYPLPVAGPANWGPGREPIRLPLPDVPADHIIAASFASTHAPGTCSFRLAFDGGHAETARFGKRARRKHRSAGEQVVVPVDYFHTHATLTNPVLSLRHPQPAPAEYLLSVCVRPRLIEPPTEAPADTALAPATRLSQTTLPPPDQPRACSPTAAAMALGIANTQELRAFVDLARHRPSGMLGVWPQNVWAAARHGRLGAVELISDWATVRRVLACAEDDDPRQPPVAMVASVAFAAGALPGSPLPESGGHLVTVRGIECGAVVTHDPAAEPREVLRRYDAVRFAAAWMRHRGAAYVFARAPLA